MDALVIFDIGATLVTGPDRGPAGRIVELLGLDVEIKERLERALMTNAWEEPDKAADFISESQHLPPQRVRAAVRAIWEAQESEATPMPGAIEAFERVARAGFSIALISNIWCPYLTSARKFYGRLFDLYVPAEQQFFSFRYGAAKPAPGMFMATLAATGAMPGRVTMIGDSFREDIEPAAKLDMNTIWLLHRPEKEADNVVRVLNGEAIRPSRTLASVSSLQTETIAALLEERKRIGEYSNQQARGMA